MMIQPYTSSPARRYLLRQVCTALKVLAAGNSFQDVATFSGMTNTPHHATSPVHKTFLDPYRACTKSVIDESFRPKVATKLSLFSQLSAPIKTGLEEVHLNVFWNFSATLNQNYGRKKTRNKKATVTFFRMVMKNTPAKFRFPTLLESGRKSVSVNVNSSPKVSKELDTLF